MGNRRSSGNGVTRRGFSAGALGTGLVLGTGRAPALAQGKRDLRVGVWGGEFSAGIRLCPLGHDSRWNDAFAVRPEVLISPEW